MTEGAIHFWDNSQNNLIANNTIYNCDRGIMVGFDQSPEKNSLIANNMIHVTRDVGIYVCCATDTKIYHNSVYIDSNYPSAIEYRFSNTNNIKLFNNLTNRALESRDGAKGEVSNNVTNAQANWFTNPQSANLHLNSQIDSVINKGITLSDVLIDFDNEARPSGAYDIGADEK